MPAIETLCLVVAILGAQNKGESAGLLQLSSYRAGRTSPVEFTGTAGWPSLNDESIFHRQLGDPVVAPLGLFVMCGGQSTKTPQRREKKPGCESDELTSLTARHQKNGDLSKAVSVLEKCIDRYPDSPAAYRVLAELHQETGQPYRAYEVYKAAIDKGVKSPEIRYRTAEIILGLAGAGKFTSSDLPKLVSEAYQLLLSLREAKAPDDRTHNLAGLALSHLGRDEAARQEFAAALQMNPSNLDYAFNLSFQLQKLRQHAQAIELLQKVIVRHPSSLEAYDRLVWSYLRTSRSDPDVEKAVASLLALDPTRSRSYLLAGNFYEGRGDLQRANRHYDSVISLEPASFEGYFAKGKVQLQQGQIQSAEASLLKALECNSRHADTLVALGKIYLRQAKIAEAEKALLAASAYDPSHLQAHFQLGTLYRRQGELEKARLELELYEKLKQEQR